MSKTPFDKLTLVPIGGPTPQDVLTWLELFISDCEATRKRSLNPFERLRLRGRAGGYDTAWWLIVRAHLRSITDDVQAVAPNIPAQEHEHGDTATPTGA